jgi:hypothetical protein
MKTWYIPQLSLYSSVPRNIIRIEEYNVYIFLVSATDGRNSNR